MEFFCIGDEDTVRGFRLAGVAGAVADSADGVAGALAGAAARPDCGVILITRAAAELARPLVEEIRLESARPLVVEL